MPVESILFAAVAEAVFGYLLGKADPIGRLQARLKEPASQKAFREALQEAYRQFEEAHPQWTQSLFDLALLTGDKAVPLLAACLARDGPPPPELFAERWAEHMGIPAGPQRERRVEELTPVARAFLDDLTKKLRRRPEFQDLFDSRILDAILQELRKIYEILFLHAPSPPTPPPTLHTIPAPVQDFTGRQREIQTLVQHLTRDEGTACISGVRGMGGVGKTELAYKVAQVLWDRFPDAHLLVDCQEGERVRPPEELLGQVVQALQPGVRLPPTLRELQALYRAALHGKRGFLLLDNAAEGRQVAPLLPPAAGWAALITSRQRFALPCAVDLDVLPRDQAVALLQTILSEGNRQAREGDLARLADLCGCLPLALRLAGGYLTTYRDTSVAEYLALVERERLRYLADDRQSVQASLAVSVRRLERDDPALAHRWRMLALFPAPFDRAAAAAVWGQGDPGEGPDAWKPLPEGEARAGLQALVARSLFSWDEASGTYTLHDLLREFALERGEDGAPPPGDDPATRARHAWHYLARGAEANALFLEGGERVLPALRAFEAAWPHLRAAWGWMRTRAGARAADLWLDLFPGSMPYVLDLRLPPREQVPLLQAAVEAARRLGEKGHESVHLGNLGLAYHDLGEVREGFRYYKAALALAREIGDRRGEGVSLGSLGRAYHALGEVREAIRYYQKALALAWEIGDRRNEGAWLGNLGRAYHDLGEVREAVRYYQEALAIHREIGDRRGEAVHSWNLGRLLAQEGRLVEALPLLQFTVDYERAIGHPDAEKHAQVLEELRRQAAGGE